jgi:anion-transporting  ArsA/GET3 family ATPase
VSLADVVASHRVVVCVGAGGVGKTTTAAALAVHAAMAGKRVLCLTIDPARRLANSLGLSEMNADEQEISAELFEKHGLEITGSLSAMMLDTKRTFDDLVTRYASSPEACKRILDNRIYEYVSTSLAGTSEYMAMEKLHAVRQRQEWDLIVLDTPPTSNALDFLDAPAKMVGLVDSPAMRWFIEAFTSTGKLSLGLVGKGAALVLKGLAKFTGAEFLDSVAEFVRDLNDLFGGFRERAEQVAAALKEDDVAFVIVTSPSPLSVDEALFFHERLASSDMAADAIVINGVHPLLAETKLKEKDLIAAVAEAVPEADAKRMTQRMRRALDDSRVLAVADRIQADRMKNALEDALCVEVPAFEEDVHDLPALAKVAEHLTMTAREAA